MRPQCIGIGRGRATLTAHCPSHRPCPRVVTVPLAMPTPLWMLCWRLMRGMKFRLAPGLRLLPPPAPPRCPAVPLPSALPPRRARPRLVKGCLGMRAAWVTSWGSEPRSLLLPRVAREGCGCRGSVLARGYPCLSLETGLTLVGGWLLPPLSFGPFSGAPLAAGCMCLVVCALLASRVAVARSPICGLDWRNRGG